MAGFLDLKRRTSALLAASPRNKSGTKTRMLWLENSSAVCTMLLLKPHHSWIMITVFIFSLRSLFLVRYPSMFGFESIVKFLTAEEVIGSAKFEKSKENLPSATRVSFASMDIYQLFDLKDQFQIIIMQSLELNQEAQQDLAQLFVDDVGEGKFLDAEYEDIKREEEQEFYLQVDEPTGPSVKSIPIASMPTKHNPFSKEKPNIQLLGYRDVIGFNDDFQTIILLQNSICRAVGANILYDGKIYTGHNHTIVTISYHENENCLFTGTNGRCPEIIGWKVQQKEESKHLQMVRKWNQPGKSESVAHIVSLNSHYFISIDKFSLHKSCQLYIFEKDSSKRQCSSSKLGKVLDTISLKDSVMFVNNKGLYQIIMKQQEEANVQEVFEEPQITAGCAGWSNSIILLGKRNGQLLVLQDFKKINKNKLMVHSTWILQIKKVLQKDDHYISLGMDRTITVFSIDSEQSFEILQKIQFDHYCKSLSIQGKQVLLGLKGGQIKRLQMRQDKKMKLEDVTIRPEHYSNEAIPRNVKFDRFTSKYYYLSKDKLFNFKSGEKDVIVCHIPYHLSRQPYIYDLFGSTIVYVSFESAFKPKSSLFSMSKSSFMKKSALQKSQSYQSILVLEDFIDKKVIQKIILKQESKCTELKFNPNGDKICLGFANGAIQIYNSIKLASTEIICEADPNATERHTSAISQIVWSKNSPHLKTQSDYTLHFYELVENDSKYQLQKVTQRKTKDKQFYQISKYGWENKHVWSKIGHISEISNIRSDQKLIYVCMSDGQLKIYENPPIKFENSISNKLFKDNFDVLPIEKQPKQNSDLEIIVHNKNCLVILQYGERKAENEIQEEDNEQQQFCMDD